MRSRSSITAGPLVVEHSLLASAGYIVGVVTYQGSRPTCERYRRNTEKQKKNTPKNNTENTGEMFCPPVMAAAILRQHGQASSSSKPACEAMDNTPKQRVQLADKLRWTITFSPHPRGSRRRRRPQQTWQLRPHWDSCPDGT